MQASKSFKGKVIKNNTSSDQVEQLGKAGVVTNIKEVVRPRSLSMIDNLAGDTFYHKNYYYPGGKAAFEMQPKMQIVDKYYPYAEGGPLFVDECTRKEDLKEYDQKVEIMAKLGHRYLLVKPGMSEMDLREAMA